MDDRNPTLVNVVGSYALLDDGNSICIRCGCLVAQTFQEKHDSACPGDTYKGDRVCYCQHSDADYERLRSGLETIVGPEDGGLWIGAYRDAGGGYAGLQAIAREALR